jgi:pimeloyl-ACP methyl ester carboxylesterase
MNPIRINGVRAVLVLAAALVAGCEATEAQPALGPGPSCGLPPAPATVQLEVPCSERSDARVTAMSDAGIGLTSELGLPPGRFALPATAAPTQLVVMFHGHQNDSCSWRDHLREVAARGGIAVAMDYTGQVDKDVAGFGFIENWGWFVRSGAADSITAARYFLDQYPSITQVINFGTSMGGNASGYAAYVPEAVRADCSPLWDWWIATEGVHNLTEEYTGARTLAPGNATAAQAQQEIEEENGGTLEDVPERYAEITSTAHAAELAYLKGVVLAHGTTDQTVPFDQSQQMASNLRANGVPVRFYHVTPSDHVWEGDGSTQVMKLGLDALYALMAGGTVTDGDENVAGP